MKALATRAGFVAAAMVAAASAGMWIGQVAPLGAQGKTSVWDGAYSEAQAARGKDEYEYNCGNCHIHDLSGDSIKDVPPLATNDFLGKWYGKSVKELLDYITQNMPQDSRGSLGAYNGKKAHRRYRPLSHPRQQAGCAHHSISRHLLRRLADEHHRHVESV